MVYDDFGLPLVLAETMGVISQGNSWEIQDLGKPLC